LYEIGQRFNRVGVQGRSERELVAVDVAADFEVERVVELPLMIFRQHGDIQGDRRDLVEQLGGLILLLLFCDLDQLLSLGPFGGDAGGELGPEGVAPGGVDVLVAGGAVGLEFFGDVGPAWRSSAISAWMARIL
jgi:hypothetical protein